MISVQTYLEFEPIAAFKDELLNAKNPEKYFQDSIRFGTAGLRGLMQPGSFGINGFTVAQASKALAHYLKHLHPHKLLTVCISYDNRHHSMQFAEIAARVLAHEGVHVKLASSLRPTPWLSFAIRDLKADAGIMITASHNPKIYNGFKVYLGDGGQIVSPHDKNITKIIETTTSFYLASPHDPRIELMGADIDQKYMHRIKSILKPEHHCLVHIVYSPLCGTGSTIIAETLKEMGFSHLYLVEEEMLVDPEFAGIATPNPETDVAMARSIKKLLATHSDIALVTDPDADRIGLCCSHHGRVVKFTGHQIASLILDYLIETTPDLEEKIVINSFVTTHLLKAMCLKHHITHIETLTGFKYIGQIIEELEAKNQSNRFLLGAEESYGYLVGTQAKDKDAIIISVILAKAADKAKKKGQTLYDRLLELYQEYGLYIEETMTLDFPLDTKLESIKAKITPLADKYPTELFHEKVESVIDYQTEKKLDLSNGAITSSPLPPSEGIGFFTKNSWLIIRPSGTEPKLKIYAGIHIKNGNNIEELQHQMTLKLKQELQNFCHRYLG